ncbi:hypothetical protein [Kineosporia sp. NBRC 101731]|uniref:hypothetical protein n=1 Tax=Kineosporia sp. NBRC 101731 TaxID=3032199 RepID=UPI0024A557F0|nr:hypothetical protein [Kineosporia sp. NBRC 101731]GLY28879.1 hypothetical protein Kisp02_22440 [Kineosporia sp. NBRC 101731]
MPSDIQIVYADVRGVAVSLRSVTTRTLPRLTTVQDTVNALLTDPEGLWLCRSSPALQDQYQAFHRSVARAIDEIPTWAAQFEGLTTQIEAMSPHVVPGSGPAGHPSER